ncbi:hypothetical protein C8N46_10944 [Kordia periserrulae]|uniref:Lipocalin-like protein n=1 Tax=Kordia periserrulae TaxID=701523 RepID=A0A2T6BTT9_9FLAO|nr:hypothetical protein [Kordia periserrulae]PTX59456.1 hypothetical protein C8N46_10944 [Kordia periserrulae]
MKTMKTRFNLLFLVMLSFSLMSTTCETDDDVVVDNSQTIAEITDIAETSTWRITSYVDSGQDETNDFNNYNFTFAANGTVTASNGTDQVQGTWSVTDDSNSNDDSNSDDDIDFNISFNVPTTSNFFDLNDDWDIISYSNTTISLQDISGGNGGTDTLVFQRNN